jgi:hypothetical protein
MSFHERFMHMMMFTPPEKLGPMKSNTEEATRVGEQIKHLLDTRRIKSLKLDSSGQITFEPDIYYEYEDI